MVRFTTLGSLVLLASAFAAGCAHGSTLDDAEVTLEGSALSQEAQIASQVVVADAAAAAAAVVADGEVRIPMHAAGRVRTLVPGSVFVSARGATDGKNPDGFLRRVVAVREDRGVLVVSTEKATITDAIVRGELQTGPFGVRIDDHDSDGEAAGPRDTKSVLPPIDLRLDGQTLFENTDVIEGANGPVRFKQTITIDQGRITSQPDVDVDLRIQDGKVSRFMAKVEGTLDAKMLATARVEADGPASDAVLAELRAKKHHLRKVLHTTRRTPLPTRSIGRVPVSPSVQVTVALVCDLSFGGAHVARAGVQARSSVRLTAAFENGAWKPPSASAFDIQPTFQVAQPGEVESKCALESSAELSAYGVGGVTMTVAPWVSYDVTRGENGWTYRAEAGATGAMHGSADIFGVKPEDLERTLVDWTAGASVTGTAP